MPQVAVKCLLDDWHMSVSIRELKWHPAMRDKVLHSPLGTYEYSEIDDEGVIEMHSWAESALIRPLPTDRKAYWGALPRERPVSTHLSLIARLLWCKVISLQACRDVALEISFRC